MNIQVRIQDLHVNVNLLAPRQDEFANDLRLMSLPVQGLSDTNYFKLADIGMWLLVRRIRRADGSEALQCDLLKPIA